MRFIVKFEITVNELKSFPAFHDVKNIKKETSWMCLMLNMHIARSNSDEASSPIQMETVITVLAFALIKLIHHKKLLSFSLVSVVVESALETEEAQRKFQNQWTNKYRKGKFYRNFVPAHFRFSLAFFTKSSHKNRKWKLKWKYK